MGRWEEGAELLLDALRHKSHSQGSGEHDEVIGREHIKTLTPPCLHVFRHVRVAFLVHADPNRKVRR